MQTLNSVAFALSAAFLFLLLPQSSVAEDPLLVLRSLPQEAVTLELTLHGDAQPSRLALSPRRVWTADAKIHVHQDDGLRLEQPPADQYYLGRIEGESGSRAMLRVAEDGSTLGLVASSGGTWVINSDGSSEAISQAALHELPEHDTAQDSFQCETLEPPASAEKAMQDAWLKEMPIDDIGTNVGPAHSGSSARYEARIAIETDHAYFQRLGHNSQQASRYMADMFAFISSIYEDELDTALTISYLSLWETSNEPWTQHRTLCALNQFGWYWNSHRTHVERSLAHFVSGRNMGGGVAWLGVLCGQPFTVGANCPGLPSSGLFGGDYGLSANIAGNFNPNNPQPVWDITVIAHELGHNFNSPHTHCYGGIGGSGHPVDRCYGGESGHGCHAGGGFLPGPMGQGSGTIMSYCHLLQGGQSNIAPTLGAGHPYGVWPQRVPNRMLSHVQARAAWNPSCLLPSAEQPGFGLTMTNTEQSVCRNPAADLQPMTVSTQSLGGFSGDVQIYSSPRLPDGFSGSLTRNPIPAGQDAELRLSVSSLAATGRHEFDILGRVSGMEDQRVRLRVDVSDALTQAPTALLPADLASDLPRQPRFYWQAVSGAQDYHIQVADNPQFNNPVVNAAVAGTDMRPATTLNAGAEYFWRVRARSSCGDSPWSSIRRFTTEGCTSLMAENLDGSLVGWSTNTDANGQHFWSLSTQRHASAPRSVFTAAPERVSDRWLTSPAFDVPVSANQVMLDFSSWMAIEAPNGNTCYDGALIEVSVNGGLFYPVEDWQLTGRGYTGTISAHYGNPAAHRRAWCGSSQGFESLGVDLSRYRGERIRLRFRLGTDSSIGAEGWYIDDVRVQACTVSASRPSSALTLAVNGSGELRSADGDISCSSHCDYAIDVDQAVLLNAVPASGFRFDRWSGACEGEQPACQVYMNQARDVQADFLPDGAAEPDETIFADRFQN